MIWQKYITPVLKAEISFPECIKPTEKYGKQILTLLYEIRNLYFEKRNAYELLIKTTLYEIWYLLLSNSEYTNRVNMEDNNYRIIRIKSILEYICTRYNQKITLPELSSAFNMSE